jgi:hypothetical protein
MCETAGWSVVGAARRTWLLPQLGGEPGVGSRPTCRNRRPEDGSRATRATSVPSSPPVSHCHRREGRAWLLDLDASMPAHQFRTRRDLASVSARASFLRARRGGGRPPGGVPRQPQFVQQERAVEPPETSQRLDPSHDAPLRGRDTMPRAAPRSRTENRADTPVVGGVQGPSGGRGRPARAPFADTHILRKVLPDRLQAGSGGPYGARPPSSTRRDPAAGRVPRAGAVATARPSPPRCRVRGRLSNVAPRLSWLQVGSGKQR